jgi:Cu-Zn family superoxide dismutase
MTRTAIPVALALAAAGCAGVVPAGSTGATATAELRNASGQIVGNATFTEVRSVVRVVLEARGLPPGDKAVHLHEVGTCAVPRFSSAGAHFNPDQKQHGMLNPAGPHAGDLPTIRIESDGTGRFETSNYRITLGAGSNSLLDRDGTALVIHAAPDDHRTDPTGNSGNRIACGVVVKKAP